MNRQSGSALFLILIAVALFAALSYAVTQSGRGGGTAEKERMILAIAAFESHATQIQTAIMRMRLSGIEPWQIDYSDGGQGDSVPDSNTTCTENDCKLFHPAGGGVAPYKVPDEYRVPANQFPTDVQTELGYQFKNITVAGIQSNKKDLMFSYLGVTPEFCRAFNDHVGFPHGSDGEALDDKDGVAPLVYKYDGTLTEEVPLSYTSTGLGDDLAAIDGTPAFCVKSWTPRDYNYIWILLLGR